MHWQQPERKRPRALLYQQGKGQKSLRSSCIWCVDWLWSYQVFSCPGATQCLLQRCKPVTCPLGDQTMLAPATLDSMCKNSTLSCAWCADLILVRNQAGWKDANASSGISLSINVHVWMHSNERANDQMIVWHVRVCVCVCVCVSLVRCSRWSSPVCAR